LETVGNLVLYKVPIYNDIKLPWTTSDDRTDKIPLKLLNWNVCQLAVVSDLT